MIRKPTPTSLIAVVLALMAGLSLTPSVGAVVPGRNGRIAFTSGREGPNDNLSQLYLREAIGSTGFGALSPPFTPIGGQSRHPSWSPDRTKVVFANGTPGAPTTEEFDLFVKDFVNNTITPLDGAELGDGLSSDRPAWSHDGTRIAYEHQPTDNSAERDIKVKTLGSSAPAVSLTTGAPVESKPAWSPDDETIYYAKTSAGPPVNLDIAKRPSAGGAEVMVTGTTGADEFQPAISPDGSAICFTSQSPPGNTASAEIVRARLPDPLSGAEGISQDNTRSDYNCTWSPDGKRIAYVSGAFSQGRLVMKNADGSSPLPVVLEDDLGSNNFDGNPDWAPDGSPDCPDRTVTTTPNTPVTIELECTDTGPAYERTDPNGTVTDDGQPQNGTTSDAQPTANPSTVKYTPDPGFTGTDRIAYTAFDKFGFGTDRGTVTINVQAPGGGGGGGGGDTGAPRPKCGGRTATIVGTAGNDRLRGTRRPDVIVAGSGSDRVRAGGGSDLVCGGSGRDRLIGGAGRDRLLGGRGRDRLLGGRGRDACLGGPGRDRATCERERSA